MRHHRQVSNSVPLLQTDQANALSSPATDPQAIDSRTNHNARLVSDHQIVLVIDGLNSHQLTSAFINLHRPNAFTTTVGDPVVVPVRPFANAISANYQNGFVNIHLMVDSNHTDHGVLGTLQAHAPDASSRPAHLPHFLFLKVNGLTFFSSQEYVAGTGSQLNLQ